MGVDKSLLPVLIVALLTWGGVFFYMLRLEALARALEREAQTRGAQTSEDNGVVEKVATARAGKS